MFQKKIHRTGRPLLESEVAKFESEVGYSLPPDYREFLKEMNGGVVGAENEELGFYFFNMFSKWMTLTCGELFGLNKDDASVCPRKARTLFKGRIPDRLLVIGQDFSGDQICIGLSPEIRGAVFLWLHEYEADLSQDDRMPNNMSYVAYSFRSFIDSHTEI